MGVIGHWRRSVLGASGVALLLPLGLAIGVALTAAFGGGGTLRALGQVFAGPSAPQARGGEAAPLGLESARAVPPIPVRHTAAAPVAQPTAAGGSSGGSPQQGSSHQGGTGTAGGGSRPATPTRPTRPSGGGHQPAPHPSPPPPSPAPGSPAHQAGQAAADAATSLPAAGTAAGGAAQTVVDLIP
jgi:hypothetical protein